MYYEFVCQTFNTFLTLNNEPQLLYCTRSVSQTHENIVKGQAMDQEFRTVD